MMMIGHNNRLCDCRNRWGDETLFAVITIIICRAYVYVHAVRSRMMMMVRVGLILVDYLLRIVGQVGQKRGRNSGDGQPGR